MSLVDVDKKELSYAVLCSLVRLSKVVDEAKGNIKALPCCIPSLSPAAASLADNVNFIEEEIHELTEYTLKNR